MRIGLFTDTLFSLRFQVLRPVFEPLKTELEKQGHAVFIFTTTDRMSIVMKIGKLSAFQVFLFCF